MLDVRGNRISMIFQEPMSSLNPIYRVGNQIAEALILHQRLTKKQALARALDLLKEVRIPEPEARLEQYPHQLSGGQRQRVMIAMAIANNPEFLIADEPTTALDVTVQAEILKLIRQLQARHDMGVLLITHDLTIVEKVSDTVAVMRLGQVVETNTTRRALRRAAASLYEELFASAPSGQPNPVAPKSEIVLKTDKLRVEYHLRWGGMFSRQNAAARRRRRCQPRAPDGETLGIVGEFGLRQDDARQGDPPPPPQRRRRDRLEGRASRGEVEGRDAAVPPENAGRLPGPVLLAQSAALGEADHRGGPDRERHRRQQAASATRGSAPRLPMSASTRTR